MITCGVAVQQSEAALLDFDDCTLQPRDLSPRTVPSGNKQKGKRQEDTVGKICQQRRPLIVAHLQQINTNGRLDLHYHSSKYEQIRPLI